MKVKAIIIEDEINGQEVLTTLLAEFFPQIAIVGIADSLDSALSIISSRGPEIYFVDIQLKINTGFDILQKTDYLSKAIIFTTAFSNTDYLLDAINKYQAVGYLLKPFSTVLFKSIVEKALQKVMETKEVITIPSREGFDLIRKNEIIRLEGSGAYTEIHTVNQHLTASKNIGFFHDMLPEKKFARVHKSHIVNLDFVEKYKNNAGGELLLKNGQIVPIGDKYKDRLWDFWGIQ